MVKNRDVSWDSRGKPRASVRASGETAECTWVHMVVDISAIGMPIDSPLVVTASRGRRLARMESRAERRLPGLRRVPPRKRPRTC